MTETTTHTHKTKTSNANDSSFTGSCLCGGVRYSVNSRPLGVANCHCSTCRRLSGSPFMTFAGVPIGSVEWISKATLAEIQYTPIATRAFCKHCGSPIYMQYRQMNERISFVVGSIDEDSIAADAIRPTDHIFCKEKATWYELTNDGLDRYDEFPPASTKRLLAEEST